MGLVEVKTAIQQELKSIESEIEELNGFLSQDNVPTWRMSAMKDRKKYLEGRQSLANELVEKIEKMG